MPSCPGRLFTDMAEEGRLLPDPSPTLGGSPAEPWPHSPLCRGPRGWGGPWGALLKGPLWERLPVEGGCGGTPPCVTQASLLGGESRPGLFPAARPQQVLPAPASGRRPPKPCSRHHPPLGLCPALISRADCLTALTSLPCRALPRRELSTPPPLFGGGGGQSPGSEL